MAIDLAIKRSRRALLVAVTGGVAGALAATASVGQRVLAGIDDGTPWNVGTLADTQTTTHLRNDSTGASYPVTMSITNATNTAIEARAGTGFGLHAEATGDGWTSIVALKESPGSAVAALIVDRASGSASVEASTEGTGPAVYGESARGRGGRFKGKKAQIRLDPSGASTHPASGAAGDLFVDSAKRLWFCRGGSSWVRVA